MSIHTLPRSVRIVAAPLLFLAIGYILGSQSGSEAVSHAEVRKPLQRKAFEAGFRTERENPA